LRYNLLRKVDNRSVATSYTYDGLNRVVAKTYSTGNTLPVSYAYDSAGSNSIGHLTSVGNTSSVTSYASFDAMRRAGSSKQATAGQSYLFGYTYDQSGSLASESYPSGRVVNTCYDLANRVSQVGVPACGNAVGAWRTRRIGMASGVLGMIRLTRSLRGRNVIRSRASITSGRGITAARWVGLRVQMTLPIRHYRSRFPMRIWVTRNH
jgi:YD repeat-containing protein